MRNEESGEEEEEGQDVKSKRSHSWWEQEQERLVAEGKRKPIDRSYVSLVSLSHDSCCQAELLL